MLNLLQKIILTGTVTEGIDDAIAGERFRGEITIDRTHCKGCWRCSTACPVQAITPDGISIAVDPKKCIFCGRCVEVCGNNSLVHSAQYKLASIEKKDLDSLGKAVQKKIRNVLGRSLHVRHVDVGSCNACDFEMAALGNPIYDIQQYGIDFVASPRHADMLMVTGVVTRNLTQALLMTHNATPDPKLVMAVGACAAGGNTFGQSYAIRGKVADLVPVDVSVPGCPPRPQALLYGLLLIVNRL